MKVINFEKSGVQPTGSFVSGEAVQINYTVPEGTTFLRVLCAQIQSDALLTLNGKVGAMDVSFSQKNPKPGLRTAFLTADGVVHDCNVHLTIQKR
jgi:hypothetical protein